MAFETLVQLFDYFKDEEACRQYIANQHGVVTFNVLFVHVLKCTKPIEVTSVQISFAQRSLL